MLRMAATDGAVEARYMAVSDPSASRHDAFTPVEIVAATQAKYALTGAQSMVSDPEWYLRSLMRESGAIRTNAISGKRHQTMAFWIRRIASQFTEEDRSTGASLGTMT
jgi:hypothetical protein